MAENHIGNRLVLKVIRSTALIPSSSLPFLDVMSDAESELKNFYCMGKCCGKLASPDIPRPLVPGPTA